MFKDICYKILDDIHTSSVTQENRWEKLITERLDLSHKRYEEELNYSLQSLESKNEIRVLRKLIKYV